LLTGLVVGHDQREDQVAHLAEQLATTELDKLQLQDMKEEYERRIQALSVCLEEMASENIQFWQQSESSPLSASMPSSPVSRSNDSDGTSDRKPIARSAAESSSNTPHHAATPMQVLLDEVRKTGDDRSELAMKVCVLASTDALHGFV
jgi:hypothetical protein